LRPPKPAKPAALAITENNSGGRRFGVARRHEKLFLKNENCLPQNQS
jgi:hypothetical protein